MRNHLIQDMLCMNSLFMLAKSLKKLVSLLVLFPMPQLKPLNVLSCSWRQLSLFSTQWRWDLTQTQLHLVLERFGSVQFREPFRQTANRTAGLVRFGFRLCNYLFGSGSVCV